MKLKVKMAKFTVEMACGVDSEKCIEGTLFPPFYTTPFLILKSFDLKGRSNYYSLYLS